MEVIVENVNAYGKRCIGCQKHEADIMIAMNAGDGTIHDFFLTNEQAMDLMDWMRLRVLQNIEPDEPNGELYGYEASSIDNEGLGYYLQGYTSADRMPDDASKFLFKQADEAMSRFENYVTERVEDES